jgi:threonine/homoserine/homoserine lactone efflux protein
MIGFVLLAAVVICTPGPDTALTIRNTLLGGRANGLRTAQGVAVGQALWTLAASAGIAALVAASQPVFTAVRIIGAAYLVWLGLQALAAALQGRRHEERLRGSAAGFRQGLLSNLANPKMAVFFTSLLPQFGTGFGELLALGLVFSTMTLVWLSAYAFAITRT